MKCPDCEVGWSEYALEGTGRVCWYCGKEIPLPLPANARKQYVFPGDASRVREGERG